MGKVTAIAVALVVGLASGAYADLGSYGVNFDGASQSLTADITAGGSATLSGSGTYYSWVGWPVSTWASVSISFNNQTVGIGTNPDTINVNKDPDGSATVGFERLFTTLDDASLSNLSVDGLGGSAQGVALDQVTLNGEVIGLVPVELRLDASGSINTLDLSIPSPVLIGPDGQFNVAPIGQATYTALGSGNVSASLSASVTGEMEVLGLFTIGLGTLVNFNESLNEAIPYLSTVTLTELGVQDSGIYPKDVAVHLSTDLADLAGGDAIEIPFTTSGSENINTYDGSKNDYYKVNFNYAFDGNVAISNASIDLYDTIVGAIPEPATVAVFGIGGALLSLARRRRS